MKMVSGMLRVLPMIVSHKSPEIFQFTNSKHMLKSATPLAVSLVLSSLFYNSTVFAFSPSEEQAIIDSVRQTAPGITTTMSP